jgi:serine/threonine-protein kinase
VTTDEARTVDPAPLGSPASVATVAPEQGVAFDPGPLATTDHVAPARPDDAPAGPSVPGYEILSQLGRGGMGVVYKARHVGLDRVVALKMVLAGAHAEPHQLARFHAEAQAVARFQHPNIVQIHEVGTADGLPYFSLEFLDGGPLDKKIARMPQPPRFAAELVAALARAMSYAHERGVIHRDLKPANVLLSADGTPKITDFGLAKRLDGDSLQTRSGTVVGTPSFMAPEQARGDLKEVGPHSDVYSLGAILYDLLTGRPPFLGASMLDTLDQVRSQEPVPPAALIGRVPKDLETICLKCLQKEPAKRYASAAALADDLRRFLNGEPIVARPVSAPERAWRWAKRNPWVAGLGVAVAVLLVIVAGTSTVFAWQFNLKKEAAETAAAKEKKEHDRAEEALRKETEAHELADNKAQIAGEQSELAIGAMSLFLVTAQNRLRYEPQAQKLRLDLIRVAMAELDKIKVSTEKAKLADQRYATVHALLGECYLAAERAKEAAEEYDLAIGIMEGLVKDEPERFVHRRNLAAVLNGRGDAALALRETRQARDYYQRALDLRKEWAALTPDRVTPIRAIANSYALLGRATLMLGDPKTALNHYLACKEQYDQLPEGAQKDVLVRREVAELHRILGDVFARAGQEEESRRHYAESLRRRQELLSLEPNDPELMRDYALAQISEGEWSLTHDSDPVRAYAHYDAAHQILVQLARGDPNNTRARKDLAAVRYYLGATALRIGSASPGLLGVGWLTTSRRHFDLCMRGREELAKTDPGVVDGLMLAQARCGRHAEAAVRAQQLSALNDPGRLIEAACGFALSAEAVRMTGSTAPADRMLAQKYLDGAYAALRKAMSNGWQDPVRLRREPDLDSIRADTRYAALLQELTQK